VGLTGSGKTFALNCFLARQYLEEGVAFDLLEPMGHGKIIAEAVGAPLFTPSASDTHMNPLDIMYPDATEQITHVIRLVETMLGRQFSGTQQGNHQKALIGQSLARLYGVDRGVDLFSIHPHQTPILEHLCEELARTVAKTHVKKIALDVADEIAGLCTGSGPYAKFVNAQTNLDLSFRGKQTPRVFSFNKMSNDPELLAIAYTQVLTAIRRDSLADEIPRTIAVDEVYRLMQHPSLLDFLVEAVKTFRTRRKKVIVIDQQMRVFLSSEKAKLLFENCPIRVIFNQRSGMDVFREHVAFQHLTEQHLETIASLRRGHFLLDIQDSGVYYLYMKASQAELSRFGDS
jgi:type IV secretory pathway VirB4 component